MLQQTTYGMRMSKATEKPNYPQHQQDSIMKSSSQSRTTTTTTSKRNKNKKQKKKVQWYPKVKLWFIAYRSDEDYEAIWYDQDDYARFKADSRKTIDMVAQRCLGRHSSGYHADDGTLLPVIPPTTSITNEEGEGKEESEEFCTRGLEHFMSHETKQQRYNRRRKSIEVVWDEQVRQWDTYGDLHDHQRIAEMYSKVCVISRMNATMQGYSYYVENQLDRVFEQDETNGNNNNSSSSSTKLFHLLDASPPSPQKSRKKQVTTPLA